MRDYLELTLCVDGRVTSVKCAAPSLLRCSYGPMSVAGAITGSTQDLVMRLGELVAEGRPDNGFIRWSSDGD